ncbi:MAG: hypothetical protein Q9184_000649 [Pyrenodesmia sp. 2 TL-2023]
MLKYPSALLRNGQDDLAVSETSGTGLARGERSNVFALREAVLPRFSTPRLSAHVTNLIGAIWARLVPTVIALAFYFCLADSILIAQCLYYNYRYTPSSSPSPPAQIAPSEDPRQPLLTQQFSNIGLPGSRRRSSAASHRSVSQKKQYLATDLPDNDLDQNRRNRPWIMNTASIIGICLAGTAGWVGGFLTLCFHSGHTDFGRR